LTNKAISNRAVSLLSLLISLEGVLTAFFLTREPSEAGSVFAFGLSSQRLAIVIGVLLVTIFFVAISIAHFFQFVTWHDSINQLLIQRNFLRYGLIALTILSLTTINILFLFPDYYFPTMSGYLLRLKPALFWFLLILIQTFIFLAYYGKLSFESLKSWRGYKPTIIAFISVVIIWGVIAITGIGIVPDKLYWNMAGVPLLAWQVWTAIGIALIGLFLARRNKPNRLTSFVIFIGIWIVAAIIWIRTPLVPTFNAPGPYLPQKNFYPFVDAAFFDLGAQTAIYGKGLLFGRLFDRGLLMGFLALLHMLFGQNYLEVVGAQAAVFAVFPALLYLLGEQLHSKSAGLAVATLGILKVVNAIEGGKILSTSHPKLTMTEFPTGIMLVLFSLFLVFWMKQYGSKAQYLAGAGATIGVGILLRTHVFFLIPVVFVLGLWVWKQDWTRAIRDVLLFASVFFIVISPWMWRNYQVAGEPLFFMKRFEDVLDERYQPQSGLNHRLSADSFLRAQRNYTAISPTRNANIFDQYQFIPRHFAHNLVTSALILPPSPVLDDLRHVVDGYPYWGRLSDSWLGQISGSMRIYITLNLLLLAIGIGTAWKRIGFVSLVPLMVFFFYNLANAFARTSGGRYIVPADWVVYFYFAIGIVEVVRICIVILGFESVVIFRESTDPKPSTSFAKFNLGKVGLIVLPFFLMVTALPVIELMSPGEKPMENKKALMQQLDEISFFASTGLSRKEVNKFLRQPEALLISGYDFYPRYYSHLEGESVFSGKDTPYTARDYPRLVFTLLLPTNNRSVLFPTDESRLYFPDAAEVIVGGCQVGQSAILKPYLNYISAAFVVIKGDPEMIYVRVPEAPLTCPLREPECDNNRNCR
jgi:hypothetical protein